MAAALPYWMQRPLFGDRRRWGRTIREDDPDWQGWLAAYMQFYRETQKGGIGKAVNDVGYAVLREIDLEGRRVLEIGPGILPHRAFWRGRPAHYTVADIKKEFLDASLAVLAQANVPAAAALSSQAALPLADSAYDVVISFYSLEHIEQAGIDEVCRVLRPGGTALVMLYRKGNPKWWATATLRGLARFAGRSNGVADRLRSERVASPQGTALLELFGVPVLRAFTNAQCARMFSQFSDVRISNHQPGFERLCDILSWLRPVRPLLRLIDQSTERFWGFYQVIEARK